MYKKIINIVLTFILAFSAATFAVDVAHGGSIYDEFFNKVDEKTDLEKNFEIDATDTLGNEAGGIGTINRAVRKVTEFWKYIIGAIAVLMVVIAGFRMASTSEEDVINNQKKIILWSMIGLILVLVIDFAVTSVFYGQGGQYVFEDEASIRTATRLGKEEIEGLINWILPFVGAVAVLMIFLSGVRMIMAFGNEEVIKKERALFYWVGFGLVMIAVSKILVNTIYEPQYGGTYEVKPGSAKETINEVIGLIEWFLVIVAVIAFASLLYGGFLMIIHWGYEEGVEKAKKIITASIIGLIIIFSSYAIVATVISGTSGY